MAAKILEVMTPDPVTCDALDTVAQAARAMRAYGIGDVIVLDGERICGVVTDRDLVVRVIAEDLDPRQTALADVCSSALGTLKPDDEIGAAIELMAGHAVRRIPIVSGDAVVGIVSMGDLAQYRDERTVLAAVSAAPPNT